MWGIWQRSTMFLNHPICFNIYIISYLFIYLEGYWDKWIQLYNHKLLPPAHPNKNSPLQSSPGTRNPIWGCTTQFKGEPPQSDFMNAQTLVWMFFWIINVLHMCFTNSTTGTKVPAAKFTVIPLFGKILTAMTVFCFCGFYMEIFTGISSSANCFQKISTSLQMAFSTL